MTWLYPGCPQCHYTNFGIRREKETGRIEVICGSCGQVVLQSQSPAAEQQAGSIHAPSGGPFRP